MAGDAVGIAGWGDWSLSPSLHNDACQVRSSRISGCAWAYSFHGNGKDVTWPRHRFGAWWTSTRTKCDVSPAPKRPFVPRPFGDVLEAAAHARRIVERGRSAFGTDVTLRLAGEGDHPG
jgi:hypothetical protein